jgi:hypothetical protein
MTQHIPTKERYWRDRAYGFAGDYADYVDQHYQARLSQDRRFGHQSPSPAQYQNMVALANDAKGF